MKYLIPLLFMTLSVQATDYTRMAQEIARESVPQRDASISEARRFIESTKNQKYPSFFGFDETTKEPVFQEKEAFQPKESGETCRKAKMRSDAPKARYQGDSGLYIFVSLSLPDDILKTLSQQAKAMGGNLVIQGLVKNSFKETQIRLRELGIPIDIDPTLFERFDVKRIPTFVLAEIKDGDIQGPYDKVTGNVSVRSALELFAMEGELLDLAQSLLQNKIDDTIQLKKELESLKESLQDEVSELNGCRKTIEETICETTKASHPELVELTTTPLSKQFLKLTEILDALI